MSNLDDEPVYRLTLWGHRFAKAKKVDLQIDNFYTITQLRETFKDDPDYREGLVTIKSGETILAYWSMGY